MADNKNITEELLALYLEGKTNEAETEQVLKYLASNDDALDSILTAGKETALQQSEKIEKKKRTSIYSRSIMSKADLDDDTRYQIAGHGKIMMAAETQNSAKTCAIKAQQIILEDYGIKVSTEELIKIAQENGWFLEEQGTPLDFVGELLNYYKVNSVQMRNANIYNLMHELSLGHKIIIGVNSNDLAQTSSWRNYDEIMIGKEANHVLVVAGIDTSNPNDLQVVLTDPTNSENQKKYPAKQFLEAWEDSGYFMVTTQDPAPLAYNPEMKNFDYRHGYIEKIADIAYTEIIKRLAEDGYLASNNKKTKIHKKCFFIIAIIVFVAAIIFSVCRYFSPIDMKIFIMEDSEKKISSIPFKSGKITVQYEDLKPEIFDICTKNLIAIVDEISYKNKNGNAHIIFQSDGYETIDTIIKIKKIINLTICRDNSLSKVFGTIIDGRTGLPTKDVKITLQDISVLSNKEGHFNIDIPFSKQRKVQRLQAYKAGYQLWTGSYEPSNTNAWEIVLLPE